MGNETIDKLKNAGYITVTDDSQGIADKVGISGGGIEPYFVQGAEAGDGLGPTYVFISQEEFARVKTAFFAGRPVIIPEVDSLTYLVTGYSRDIMLYEGNPIEGFALHNESKGYTSEFGAANALIAEI